jgi:hypothetical protein
VVSFFALFSLPPHVILPCNRILEFTYYFSRLAAHTF